MSIGFQFSKVRTSGRLLIEVFDFLDKKMVSASFTRTEMEFLVRLAMRKNSYVNFSRQNRWTHDTARQHVCSIRKRLDKVIAYSVKEVVRNGAAGEYGLFVTATSFHPSFIEYMVHYVDPKDAIQLSQQSFDKDFRTLRSAKDYELQLQQMSTDCDLSQMFGELGG